MADATKAAEAGRESGFASAAAGKPQQTARRPPTPSVRPVAGSIGPYSLLCELGSGGMGKVFLAKRTYAKGVNRVVALKVQRPEFATHPRSKEMFLEEASIAARIVHPYVCAVSDVGLVGDACYVVMDYIVGEPLSRVAERAGKQPDPLAIACTLRIIANLCEGLHAVHEARDEEGAALNVVHRDIAPDNLFVLYDGTVRVTDFGVACTEVNRTAGRAGGIVGKCAYMAPEQMRGKDIDRRSDIWSMSVVLWELLTGRALFRHLPDMAVVANVLTATIEPPSAFNGHVPSALDEIVLRGLSRDPDRRFASARELGSELERVLDREFGRVGPAKVGSWLDALFPGGQEFRFRLVARAKELLEAQRNNAQNSGNIDFRRDDPVDRALSRLSSPSNDSDVGEPLTFVYDPQEHALRATPLRSHAEQGPQERAPLAPTPLVSTPLALTPAAQWTSDTEHQKSAHVRAAARRLPTRFEIGVGAASATAFLAGALLFAAPAAVPLSASPSMSARTAAPNVPPHLASPRAASLPSVSAVAGTRVEPARQLEPPTQGEGVARGGDHVAPDGQRRETQPAVPERAPSAKAQLVRAARANTVATGDVYVSAAMGREAYVLFGGREYRLPHAVALPAGAQAVRVRFADESDSIVLHVNVTPGYMSMLVARPASAGKSQR